MNQRLQTPAALLFCFLAYMSIAGAQHKMSIFSDEADYQSSLAKVPKSNLSHPPTDILDAHFNYGMGAQFNTPVSLSAIACDLVAARQEMTESISGILTKHGYSLGIGWDKFGFLKATQTGKLEIDLNAATWGEIELQVKVDQTELGERAITFAYQVSTYLRRNDPGTRQDRSSEKVVERYMESLRGEMRRSVEAALRVSCTKNTVHEITTEESGIQKMSIELKLTKTQEEQLRAKAKKNDR